MPEFDPQWFNISAPWWRIGGARVRLFQAFNRRALFLGTSE